MNPITYQRTLDRARALLIHRDAIEQVDSPEWRAAHSAARAAFQAADYLRAQLRADPATRHDRAWTAAGDRALITVGAL